MGEVEVGMVLLVVDVDRKCALEDDDNDVEDGDNDNDNAVEDDNKSDNDEIGGAQEGDSSIFSFTEGTEDEKDEDDGKESIAEVERVDGDDDRFERGSSFIFA